MKCHPNLIILVVTLLSPGLAQGVYERAGWKAQFNTLFHQVSGEVTIEDAQTLRIDHFYYDGGGPAVYFYLGAADTQTAFMQGIPIGPLLSGRGYQDETLIVALPSGRSLDGVRAVSVWCADFRVNFGSGTFGSVVEYEVQFDATWSMDTHMNFPKDPHFSGLIGAAHTDAFTLWQLGKTAGVSVETMAETGEETLLIADIEAGRRIGTVYSLISSEGLTVSPGSVSTRFIAHSTHPLVSLVSMITPSPDWFLGVADLPLFENGRWRREVTVDLYPYDAGTDNGVDFTSPDADTQPPDVIHALTGFPFADTLPLGTFTFRLQCPSPPAGDLNGDCRVDAVDLALLSSHWLIDCSIKPYDPACSN